MMTTFESTIRQIPYPQQQVYQKLSNLEHLGQFKDRIPADKADSFSFDADSLSINVPPVGSITMRIVDREEPKTVKFEAAESPVPFNFWIQLVPVSEDTCKMKLTLKAELNIFIKGMVQKPLTEGIEKIADVLQAINYGE